YTMFVDLSLSLILLTIAFAWVLSNFVHRFRSVGYSRYNLYMVYGDTGNPVGFGGVIIVIILAPIRFDPLVLQGQRPSAVLLGA
ncbi:hypothetical protein JYB64_23455, partial [Algoriphagus aestuarii]|nr:hypothetical protein [Algoriphagus aestuarii]